MLKHLAIVPARGGSKRLAKKNLKLLAGKPLVQHTLEAVAFTNRFSKIILSSDDDDLLAVADNVPGVTAEKREVRLATDKTKVIDLINEIAARDGYQEQFDTISLFLPTCPFRMESDIIGGLDLLDRDVDAVVSISKMHDPIQLSMTLDDDTKVIDCNAVLNPSPLITGNTRSQDFKTFYRANGGFYMAWIDRFREMGNYFRGNVRGFVIDQSKIVDIDDERDFAYAQFLIDKGYIQFEH